jgi:hypothetical protein
MNVKLLQVLNRLMKDRRGPDRARGRPQRRDADFVGGSNAKAIEQAPPGRAEELAGHAVERIDT